MAIADIQNSGSSPWGCAVCGCEGWSAVYSFCPACGGEKPQGSSEPIDVDNDDTPVSTTASGDAHGQTDTSASLALNSGRRPGNQDYKFGERVSIIKYLRELNYLLLGPDGRLVQNTSKPRFVHLPFMKGKPHVAVDSAIAWHKKSLPGNEDWDGMRTDPELQKELGEDWFSTRSRIPRSWVHKLNLRRISEGLPSKGVPGRKRHVDNYPELVECISELDTEHYDRRVRRKREANFEGMRDTLKSIIEMKNADLADAGLQQIPIKMARADNGVALSRGWVQGLQKDLMSKTQSVGSNEAKSVEPADREEFDKDYAEKLRLVADPRMQSCFDEFCGYKDRPPRKVLVHRDEPEKRPGHIERVSGGRLTWTGGVIYGPAHKGLAFFCAKAVPQDTLKLIRRDFSKVLRVVSNESGSVHGETHIDHVIPLQAHCAQRARNLFGKPLDAAFLVKEDRAPGHIGDSDSHTKATGLQQKRADKHREHNLVRCLIALNDTPESCDNDQLHHILQKDIDERIRENSLRAKDWTKDPVQKLQKRGGIVYTHKGYHRGPHHYILAKSLAEAWINFPQILCTASMIRSGAITKDVAAKILDVSLDVMEGGIQDLERRQQAVKKINHWRHAHQNAIDKGQERLPSRIISEDWDWLLENAVLSAGSGGVPLTPQQQSAMDDIEAGRKQVKDAQAKTLMQLITEAGNGTTEEKEEGLVSLDYGGLKPDSNKGTLACLDEKPGPTNAGEVELFTQCMDALFGKTSTYLRRKAHFMHQVWDWQLHLFRLHWQDKRKKQDPEVRKTDFNLYAWRMLKRINAMTSETKGNIVLHLVGDFRRLSLNPRGTIFKPSGKAKPKAKPAAKASASS